MEKFIQFLTGLPKLVLVGAIYSGAALAYPWRILAHVRWGERALLFGGPLAALFWSLQLLPTVLLRWVNDSSLGGQALREGAALFGGTPPQAAPPSAFFGSGAAILPWVPVLALLWVGHVLYLLQIESAGPRPHSYSMGSLPGLPDGPLTNFLSNAIASVNGLWLIAFLDQPGLGTLLLGAGCGGQLGDLALVALHRLEVLDVRDQELHGHSLQSAKMLREETHTKPDLTNLFA